ncbi:shikimate dehydrogenase family protein [Segetibacter koreensis]|uniref:shikimate dehydrogenase family protein n=1 Tax=Segetibacter koreensis TaxID=398037 RepID=UPI00036DC921|nr:shikimate dehydrogenase [Segetibacter koreensis]
MRKFGLIGYPLSHSFSPAFFAEKFKREGHSDCVYEAFPIKSIDEFQSLLTNNPELEGLNVTIPYKKDVFPFLQNFTEAVEKTGACNCIKIKEGKLTGYNTDVIGFEKSLLPNLTTAHTHALILGTGGAAAAVEFVLKKLGIQFLFVSRISKPGSSCLTYDEVTREIVNKYKLIINTTPLGMYPVVNSCPGIPYEHLGKEHYLYDLVYNPEQTLFLKKGAEKGAITKNGSDMLIIQAEESWKIWNEDTTP